jgi:hypothetical protein
VATRAVAACPAARTALEAMGQFDVTALLPRLKAPTLVLHRNNIPWLPIGIARALALRGCDRPDLRHPRSRKGTELPGDEGIIEDHPPEGGRRGSRARPSAPRPGVRPSGAKPRENRILGSCVDLGAHRAPYHP